MMTQSHSLDLITPTHLEETANYFGLRVEVMCKMDNCSCIRYQDRMFIVSTKDLQHNRTLAFAAQSPEEMSL